jgi:hypothetical protein
MVRELGGKAMTMRRMAIGMLALLGTAANAAAAQPTRAEVDELKKLLQQQEQSIRELKSRIQQLEGRAAPAGAKAKAAPATTPPPVVAEPAPKGPTAPAEAAEAKMFGKRSPVADRGNLDDRQEAEALPGDYVLDPSYRGYIPIPSTVFMVKFNPKPRLDMIFTTRNPGDARFRFAPANLPLESASNFGGEQFNGTANGSQIRVDMRAPTMPGNFRLYYQNDFFGSDSGQMRYRLQHFFGQYYGIVGGFTYGVFEDPDAWPDTVDYEGPNAVIFARKALIHYLYEFAPDWSVNFGMEDPGVAIDTTGDTDAATQTRAPDGGFNIRWTPGDLGHLQFSTLLRSLAVHGGKFGNDDAIGWGVNLAGSFNLTSNDTAQFMAVYGEGIGGLGNDSGFQNTDAALDSHGNLVPLQYVSGLGAFTHKWSPSWRSTATFGYVKVGNTSLQAATAYHLTRYGSVNLVYQMFKRLSIGVEGLYGFREVHSGEDTRDVYRINLGMVYSPFD